MQPFRLMPLLTSTGITPVFVGASSFDVGAVGTYNLATNWPSGAQAGDVYVVCGTVNDNTSSLAVPSGSAWNWSANKRTVIGTGVLTSGTLATFNATGVNNQTHFFLFVYRGPTSSAYIGGYDQGGLDTKVTASYSKTSTCIGIVTFLILDTPGGGSLPSSPAFTSRSDTSSTYGAYQGIGGDLLDASLYTGSSLTYSGSGLKWRTAFIVELRG